MDIEEEVIELRQEVEDLHEALASVSKSEQRNDELRNLIGTLLVKVEAISAAQVPENFNQENPETTREATPIEGPAPEPQLTPANQEAEGFDRPENRGSMDDILSRDLAQMRDSLAGERALAAELRVDLENARTEAKALLGGDIQGDLDVIRKEISAVQARVLRASLNGQI